MNSPPIANPILLELANECRIAESPQRVAGDGISALDAWINANSRSLVAEAYKRVCRNALRMYRALPNGLAFHRSNAPQRVLTGSNQAGKAQPIDEPVLTPTGWRPIGSLVAGDLILGGDGKTCMVMGVFPQGKKKVYRVTFDDGATTRCCGEHLWKVKKGTQRFGRHRHADNWEVLSLNEIMAFGGMEPAAPYRVVVPTAICDLPRHSKLPIDPYLLGVLIGDGGLTHGITVSSADQEIVDYVRATVPTGLAVAHKAGTHDYAIAAVTRNRLGHYSNPLLAQLRSLGLMGKHAHVKHVPPQYLLADTSVRLAVLRGLMDTDGTISTKAAHHTGGHTEFCTTSPQLAKDVEFLVRSLGGKCKTKWRTTSYTHKGKKLSGRPSARVVIRMPRFNPFRLTRKAERYRRPISTSDHRVLYEIEEAGEAECVCIAVSSPDSTYITNDFIVTHNTLGAVSEIARIVLGKHPHFPRSGTILCVGLDDNHLAQNMWRELTKEGSFDCIIDRDTKMPRAVRVDPADGTRIDPDDAQRESEWFESPPFLPPEEWDYADGIAYRDRQIGSPALTRIKSSGWTMLWHPSGGNPRRGIKVRAAWFDEEVTKEWFFETIPRLMRYSGRFIWSATPQTGNEELMHLINAADQGSDIIEVFRLLIADNPYIPEESKRVAFQTYQRMSQEDLEVRWYGRSAMLGRKIYPEYDPRFLWVDGYE